MPTDTLYTQTVAHKTFDVAHMHERAQRPPERRGGIRIGRQARYPADLREEAVEFPPMASREKREQQPVNTQQSSFV